ncbi:flagellar basal body P-ring formation chaperone FlgA [Ramlibacter sp. H39-3-26]|nr:flagellar basal body P-ring formation chaperone FlgA [Ramlibacter sp. H39-3-26]MDF1485799.1 flagellar basal body P-ring formation chaperone FlgA [Ramlibacter sp. H39-3-26]
MALPAAAQGVDARAAYLQQSQSWLDGAIAQAEAASPMPLRMEVSVGALDERLQLAPCAKVEPYVPAGVRLWGRARIGLRCVDGPTRWNVFLPVTVKAFGPAWVLNANVAAGTVLQAADASETEVDWAAQTAPIAASPAQWVGKVAAKPLAAGQALRQTMLKPPQLFAAGAQVRVVASGSGFSVASEGQALGAGLLGQPVRIRMDNGRIVSGTVLEDRSVLIVL